MTWPTKKLGEATENLEMKMRRVKVEESEYSQFFIKRLNNHYGLDYIIKPNDKEGEQDTEVDVYATSGKCPILNLQVVTRERVLHEISAVLRREAKRAKKNAAIGPAINMDTEKWITQAIKKKEIQYPDELKRNIILLVIGNIGSLFNENYAKQIFRGFSNSGFKGIYSVHLPSKDPARSNYLHDGQIIAIKDIFGNHGISF